MRYRYLAYKYTRRMRTEPSFQGTWESFSAWPMQTDIIWRPPVDVYETPDAIMVVVELAGVAEDAMSVTLFSDHLVIEGTRGQPLTGMSACHQLGIKYGDFKAEVDIHAIVDHTAVKAEYQNGLLTITLNKAA